MIDMKLRRKKKQKSKRERIYYSFGNEKERKQN